MQNVEISSLVPGSCHKKLLAGKPIIIKLSSLYLSYKDCRDLYWGVNPHLDAINLNIASYGGDVYAMLGLIDYIQNLDIKVNTHCVGTCMSAAAVLLACGTGNRTMTKQSTVMVHEGSAVELGKSTDVMRGVDHLKVLAKGDTHIDLHHTTEDTGIAIGECIKKALKSPKGIKRFAHALIPMDETLTRVSIDVSNRPYLIWKVKLKVEKLGEMDTELFKEWFQAFSQAAGITLHIENLYGDNSHHIIESCFKGLARALRQALEIDKRIKNKIPSTKGTL